MCYSEKQSRVSFLVNLLACVVLYLRGSPTARILALFFAFVGLMQFFDIVFWRTHDRLDDPWYARVNHWTTWIAAVANHMQPVVLGLLMYMLGSKIGGLSVGVLVVYTVVAVVYTFHLRLSHTRVEEVQPVWPSSVAENRRPSLRWEWNTQPGNHIMYSMFLLALSVLAYENFEYPLNVWMVVINLTTFVFSSHVHKGQATGRFWCKGAAWIPLLLSLVL